MENPTEINQILPYLFLGSRHAREDLEELEEKKIKHIFDLSMLPDLRTDYSDITLTCIQVHDTDDQDMKPAWKQFNSFLENWDSQSGNVFIHCNQGRSRSASCVLAYLVSHEKMTLHQAFLYLKEKRRIIMPNTGFWKQLVELEVEMTGKASLEVGKWGQLLWRKELSK